MPLKSPTPLPPRRHSLTVALTAAVTALVLAVLSLVVPIGTAAANGSRSADTSAPVLVEFSFTPESVNVADGAQNVVVTARITDETGARAPTVVITSDDTEQTFGFGSMTLVPRAPGPSRTGTWERTVAIPTTAAPGAWTVTHLRPRGPARQQRLHRPRQSHQADGLRPPPPRAPSEACLQAQADVEQAQTRIRELSTQLVRANKKLKAAKQQLRKAKATGKKAAIKKAKRKVTKAKQQVRRTKVQKASAQQDLADARARVDATC